MTRHITEEPDEEQIVSRLLFEKGNLMSPKSFLQNYMSFVT